MNILAKLTSESLLSLYPIFVNKASNGTLLGVPISLDIQLWGRLFMYLVISFIFINVSFIKKAIFTKYSILLSITNLLHIYFSYVGFQLLSSGISFTIFYTYPIMIIILSLLFTNIIIKNKLYLILSILLSIIGVILLMFSSENIDKTINIKGIIMILLAALTEAIIYFQIKQIKTHNNWNHLFIAYFISTIIMTFYILFKITTNTIINTNNITNNNNTYDTFKSLFIILIINGIIGAFGYYLRFYSAIRLNNILYAFLSYFGIIMAFIYGIIFENELINIKKIIGILLIIISNMFCVYNLNVI